jgi:hypothetical protein
MLAAGWADCFSTDFHGRPRLPLFVDEARKSFAELDADDVWRLLARTNPERICRGEHPLPVPELEVPRSLVSRFLSLFRA